MEKFKMIEKTKDWLINSYHSDKKGSIKSIWSWIRSERGPKEKDSPLSEPETGVEQ